MARDSQGRVRVDAQQSDQPLSVVVLDPVNRTSLEWRGASTTATLTTLPTLAPWHVTFPAQPMLAAKESTAQDKQPQTVTTESLGKKTIAGLAATGTRTTTTVPSGKIVHEVWFSQDLMLVVLETFTDSEGAKQTIEIQEITRTEPDPALFHEPQGYTVKQRTPFFGGGVVGGIAVPPPPLRGPNRVKLGGSVQAAKIVDHIAPTYPPLAQKANVQGTVVLHVIIGRDGKVSQVEVVSGHPLLVQAALDAVRQWTYIPTLLNGTPVEVDTTITVPFALEDKP